MSKFLSRKFIMSLVGGLLLVGNDGLVLNLPKDSILSLAGIIMTYVLGQSYVDSKVK